MVKGCFFHLTQNPWRKVGAAGMQAEHSQDEELAITIRQIPALAFATPHEVPELFAEVAVQLRTPEGNDMIHYFERAYIGRRLPSGAHQQTLFPIDMWNHHFDTAFGLPRTTNAVETLHRSFNATVGCHHLNIWNFITALKSDQGLVEVRQAKYIAGNQPTKRYTAQSNEQALRDLVRTYLHRPKLEFLRGVAHHFSIGTD